MKSSLVSILCLLVLSPCLTAQEGAEKPAPPFVGRMAPYTEWKVEYQSKNPEDKRLYRIESMTGVKVERDMKLSYAWAGGQRTEEYLVNGAVFKAVSPKFPDDIVVLDPSSETAFAPRFDKTDFPDLDWINADTFVQTVREGGYECHLYELSPEKIVQLGDITLLPEAEQAAARQLLARIPRKQAWIEVKTRLPVKYDNGYEILTFKFAVSQQKTLAPSEAFKRMMTAHGGRAPK